VYSHDVVSRLSLGSVRDLKNAAMWLCDANESAATGKTGGSGYAAVTTRARQWKAGNGSKDDPDWFIAVRKTLEANMHMADMYPPGRVLWAMRDSDLHPSHRLPIERSHGIQKLRLFEVLDTEKVFSQIVFARDMLRCVPPRGIHLCEEHLSSCWGPVRSAHMPHQYDQVLHDLL
jgi:sn1-specific diacylglycerol lipase